MFFSAKSSKILDKLILGRAAEDRQQDEQVNVIIGSDFEIENISHSMIFIEILVKRFCIHFLDSFTDHLDDTPINLTSFYL